MLNFASHIETDFEIKDILEDLKTAEIRQDFDKSISLFDELNWDYQTEPDFSNYDLENEAKLLRVAGYFLSQFGHAKKILNYQERSKNAFTRAIEIFESIDKKDLSIECHIQLSTAYWFESGLDEADIIQKISSEELGDNKNWLFLLLQVNSIALLIKKSQDNEFVLAKIHEIENLIEDSDDFKLKTQFYTQAGIVYRKNNQLHKAEECLRLAVQFARIIKAPLREGLALNSLAMLSLAGNELEIALARANEALKLFQGFGNIGWIPHILDTIAQIYFKKGDLDSAYQYIRESVMKFRNSDDYLGLCDSLCLQVEICFQLEMRSWAIDSMVECLNISSSKISLEKTQQYKDKFSNMFYVNIGNTFDERNENYIRYQLESVFKQTKSVNESARLLGISPSRLSSMRKNYGETFEALEVNTKTKPKLISQVVLDDAYFDFQKPTESVVFYEIPTQYKLGQFIAVVKSKDIKPNAFVLFQNTNIHLGKLVRNSGKWSISDCLTSDCFSVQDVRFLGEVIAVSHEKNYFVKL